MNDSNVLFAVGRVAEVAGRKAASDFHSCF